jgi:hypothetical protein
MLQKLRCAIVLTLLLPLPAMAQRMPEERGYDHRHGDYDDFRADDVAECRRACERDRRCRAYTFNLRTEMCYLKDKVNPIQRNTDMVTGSKERRAEEIDDDFSEEEGYDYRGGDYHSFRSRGVRECRRECAEDRRCVAYTYNQRSETCYLKDRIGSHQRNSDTVTGLREGSGGSRPGRAELTEERGYDYRGGDYRSFRTSGVSRCKDECRQDSRCEAYTFNLETDTCYLKDRAGNYQRNRDTVTGIKSDTGGGRPWSGDRLTEEDGYDYRGGDYDSFEASGVSACQAACRRDDRCVAYTYNRRSDKCYLKDRVGEYQRNSDTVTGVKEEY